MVEKPLCWQAGAAEANDVARPRNAVIFLQFAGEQQETDHSRGRRHRDRLKLPTEDLVRRIGQDHFFGERMRSPEEISAFQKFFLRNKR